MLQRGEWCKRFHWINRIQKVWIAFVNSGGCIVFARLRTNLLYLLCFQDGTYSQKLISPNNDGGSKRTVQDLLDDFSTPTHRAGKPITVFTLHLVCRVQHLFFSFFFFAPRIVSKMLMGNERKSQCGFLCSLNGSPLLYGVHVRRNNSCNSREKCQRKNGIIHCGTYMARFLHLRNFCIIAFKCPNEPWRPLSAMFPHKGETNSPFQWGHSKHPNSYCQYCAWTIDSIRPPKIQRNRTMHNKGARTVHVKQTKWN